MMQNEPKTNWDALFASIFHFKINTAVALAVVLFFAVSTAAVTLVAHSELQTTDYEPVLGQSQSGRSQVLGLASYGYNQPVCGRYSANCLNHMLIGFSNGGWQVRIDYQLQKNIVGAIRVNGWPFMDNITGIGSGYTGNDLEPGENYNFVLYRKVGNRLRKLTNLNLTAPPAPEDTQPICLPRPAPPEGCYYDGSDSCGGRLVCPTEPPAYGYQTPTADLEIRGVQETSQPNSLMILVCMNGTKSINDLKKENPNVQNFPFNYIVYGADGQKYEFVSNAGGSIEDMKNGQCLNLGTAVQPQHLAHWQATKKITFILDPYNSIAESNEYNNQHTYQGEVPTTPRVGQLVNLSGTIVLVGAKGLYGIPNLDIFNSWGWSFTQAVEANQAERGQNQIGVVPPRSPYCNSALEQIEGQCPVPAKQKITVISPNGGEAWVKGQEQAVKFSASSSVSGVNIYLKPYYACLYSTTGPQCAMPEFPPYVLVKDWYFPRPSSLTDTTQSAAVRIDADLAGRNIPEGEYLVQVSGVNGQDLDESDKPFKIASPTSAKPPYIKMTSPNGGEQITLGNQYIITWDTNISSDSPVDIMINKKALGSGGSAYIAKAVPNTGRYIWYTGNGILPLPYSMTQLFSGSDYRVAVSLTAGGPGDDSDGAFSLSAPQQLKSLSNVRLSDSVLYKGQTYRIKWDSADVEKVYIKLRKNSAGDTVETVSQTILNNGYFDWKVPTDLANGSDYVVRVVNGAGNVFADSAAFSIKMQASACLSPPQMVCTQGQTVRWYTDANGCQIPRCENLESTGGSSGGGSGGTSSPSGSSSGGPVESESGSGGGTSTSASSNISPIPPLRSFRYIKIETPSSNSWIAWREVEIYDAKGSRVTPITATASSVYKENSAEKAYDGDVGTVWNSGLYGNGAIVLDLGSDQQISKIRLLPANFPNPASTAHYVRGKSAGGSSFDPITNFSGQIFDNQWLTISL